MVPHHKYQLEILKKESSKAIHSVKSYEVTNTQKRHTHSHAHKHTRAHKRTHTNAQTLLSLIFVVVFFVKLSLFRLITL